MFGITFKMTTKKEVKLILEVLDYFDPTEYENCKTPTEAIAIELSNTLRNKNDIYLGSGKQEAIHRFIFGGGMRIYNDDIYNWLIEEKIYDKKQLNIIEKEGIYLEAYELALQPVMKILCEIGLEELEKEIK